MKNESIKAYSYRISQATPVQLVVIMYDMAIEYINDALAVSAENAGTEADYTAYRQNIKYAKRVIDQLSNGLDMQYEISAELLKIYITMSRYLIKAAADKEDKLLQSVIKMLERLRQSFYEISKNDTSEPVMKNTQQVYAGLTYSSLGNSNEYSEDPIKNRGYTV